MYRRYNADTASPLYGSMSARAAPPPNVKTTVELPQDVWRAAKIRAMDEQTDLRSVVISALRAYLKLPEARSADER